MRFALTFLLLSITAAATAAEFVKLDNEHRIPAPHSLVAARDNHRVPNLLTIKTYAGHVRYRQMINGMPVLGHHVIYHRAKAGGHYSGHWLQLTGKEKAQQSLVATKSLTKTKAIAKAKQYFESHRPAGGSYRYHNIHAERAYHVDEKKQLIQVFSISFFVEGASASAPVRPYFIIDAFSGEIIKYWDGLTTNKIGLGPGGNEKIGRYEYGVDLPKLDVMVEDDGVTCGMTSALVETVNLNHTMTGDGHFYEYVCPYHSADDATNGAYSPLNDAHYFGTVIVNMYQQWYQMKPLSFQLKMQVHFGENYENAFWDGQSMNFGDGGEDLYPLVALDIAAHEVSHGVTEQNSGLEYWGQSGGINEAFSDMAGKTAEYFARGKSQWSVGGDIIKSNEVIRFMDVPERDGNSIGDARDFEPGLDVHYTSGVYNRFFYLLATTDGWTPKKAFAVMLAANLHYWEPETDYYQAAEGVLLATDDLAYNRQDVINAAQKVGISCLRLGSGYQCQQTPTLKHSV